MPAGAVPASCRRGRAASGARLAGIAAPLLVLLLATCESAIVAAADRVATAVMNVSVLASDAPSGACPQPSAGACPEA